jgi:hypothetical protein
MICFLAELRCMQSSIFLTTFISNTETAISAARAPWPSQYADVSESLCQRNRASCTPDGLLEEGVMSRTNRSHFGHELVLLVLAEVGFEHGR